MEEDKVLMSAMRMYKRHQETMKKYHLDHPEKTREASKKYIDKMKSEDPVRYQLIKDKNNERYKNIVKPRREQEKNERNEKKKELKEFNSSIIKKTKLISQL